MAVLYTSQSKLFELMNYYINDINSIIKALNVLISGFVVNVIHAQQFSRVVTSGERGDFQPWLWHWWLVYT